MPDFQPRQIADDILQQFDDDGDGSLAAEELLQSPGLKASISVFDRDGDGRLSANEISGQFDDWINERTGLVSIRCKVSLRKRPLAGATVRLIPEPYLDGVVPEASGTTNALGVAQLACATEHMPEQLKSLKAMKPGVYRVEVTHPRVDLPAKYNTETTLGRTVSQRNTHPLSLDL